MRDIEAIRQNHRHDLYFDQDTIGELLSELHVRALMGSVLIAYADALMGLVVATSNNLDADGSKKLLAAAGQCVALHNRALDAIQAGDKAGEL